MFELVPRRKRSLAPGEPRRLLRVVRTRENDRYPPALASMRPHSSSCPLNPKRGA
jgi:hypothetical protein